MFISFEGIEGSGKSTAQRLLAEHLQGLGYDPLLTREPGGCALGRSLRPILLDARTRGLSSRAELYLFLADRAQHVAEVIRPALEAGQTVLCDRYADSTLAYQGYGRGLDPEHLLRINDMATGGLMPGPDPAAGPACALRPGAGRSAQPGRGHRALRGPFRRRKPGVS